ncbi:MAG: SpoVA/SpoVAEb family sporulation membrane protein [Clostridia bacterium]|nr:SpoVA/SpoVAEb family sporulation membrane protein [Clostridia bacterium]
MNVDKQTYKKYVASRAPASPLVKDMFLAFVTGGAICAFAEGLYNFYLFIKIEEETVRTLVPVTIVFLASLSTGLGVFDSLAKFAGAGTLVPITGFSNAVISPALDDKSEGLVMGVGAKMFTISGPVIVYGVISSVIYGVIYWLMGVLL